MDEDSSILQNDISSNNVQNISEMLSKMSRKSVVQNSGMLGKSVYESAVKGHFEMAKLLVTYGADLRYEDVMKQSILLQTISNTHTGNESMIKFLLDSGCDINHRNISGQTDFLFLMASGKLSYHYLVPKVDLVSNMNELDLRTGGSFLHLVCTRPCDADKEAMLMKLLQKGISVNGRDNNEDTPLHTMAQIACCNSLKFLLEHGADIGARNRNGETVLHTLASSNEFTSFEDSLALLKEARVDMNDLDFQGSTAIHHALMSRDTERKAIEKLLCAGVRLNTCNHLGENEIYCAVKHFSAMEYESEDTDRRSEVIRYLAQAGVSINKTDTHGVSPLHVATQHNDLDILVALIDSGADVTTHNKTGATPLHWASRNYNMMHVIIYYYMKMGHNINVQDVFGSTALHWAVWFRNAFSAQSLLQVGCDPLIKDTYGETALQLANRIHFLDFENLVTDDQFKNLEPLELQESVPRCMDSDPIMACPCLRYIKKSNENICLDVYVDHLKVHESSLKWLINTVIETNHMGLYYDIEENNDIPALIQKFMETVIDRVSKHDPLFRCNLKIAGSMLEGTKVKVPNEFDYIWILKEFENAFFPVSSDTDPNGYVKLQLRNEDTKCRFEKYLSSDLYLDCKLLVGDLYKVMNNEVNFLLGSESNFESKALICVKYLDEIWCSTSNLRFDYFGPRAKSFNISVDVVPTMFFEGWIPTGLSQGALELFPSAPMFSVVIKPPDRLHVANFTLFYRVSYAFLEQSLLRNIPFCAKKGYIMLKALLESGYFPRVVDHDNNRDVKSYVSSYLLKTCFLHELRASSINMSSMDSEASNTPPSKTSTKEYFKVALEWSKRIVLHFEKRVKEKNVPSFFNVEHNLLGLSGIDDCIREQNTYLQLIELLKAILMMAEDQMED